MSIKKVTLASLILLSLTACSGGSSNSATPSSETEQLTSIKQELSDKNNALEKMKKQLSNANAKVAEAQQNLDKISKDKQATEAELVTARQNLADAQQAQKRAEANLATAQTEAKNELNALQAKFDALTQEKDTLSTQLTNANAKVAEAQQNLDKISKDKQATEAELVTARQNLADAQQAQKRAEANLATAQTEAKNELNALQTKFDALTQEKNALSTQLTDANAKVAEAQQNLDKISKDKQATESELAKAKTDLQNAQQAKETAENKLAGKQRVIDAIHEQILKLDQKYYNVGLKEHHNLPVGFNKISYLHISPAVEEVGDGILIADRYIYKQPYSVFYSTKTKTSTLADDIWEGRFRVDHIFGEETTNLPIEGNATYVGKAFNADNLGQLTYTVNFSEKTGQGTLSGFDKWADIQLEKGFIENSGITANASMQDGTMGKYELGFYGPNAEEIAGEAYMFKHLEGSIKSNGRSASKYNYSPNRGTMFGFGGERGEIAK